MRKQWRERRPVVRSLLSTVGVLLAIAVGGCTSDTPDEAPDAASVLETGAHDLGPGCAPARPAVAHRAGGVIVDDPQGAAPIPCAVSTGFRTGEVSLVVTNEGTILFQPAWSAGTDDGQPFGVLRSVDQGATWEFIDPGVEQPRTRENDMWMWADRQTGRVFWTNDNELPVGKVAPPRVDYSDDGGRTWMSSALIPGMRNDHAMAFGGPPPEAMAGLLQGYPSVVYYVVSGGFTCREYDFCGTHFAKSLDGGMTFSPGAPLPYPPEYPAPGIDPVGGYGLPGAVTLDGTVYVPFTPCQRPYIAISHDMGDTWELALVADTETMGYGELGLGLDEGGTLYAAWTPVADRLLYLAVSRDGGQHWSAPKMIGAPGLTETAVPFLVVGAAGQVAVTYYGSTNRPVPAPPDCGGPALECPGYESQTWNTYIVESWNALDEEPVFWSATLNDPAYPTLYGATPSSFRSPDGWVGGYTYDGRIDYFAATMDADHTPWVGYAQACPAGVADGNPNCQTATGTRPEGLTGWLGRLAGNPGDGP